MERALGKPHPRVVGVDDGAFGRHERYAPIAAVVLTLPDRIEAVRVGRVRVDGQDATARIVRLLKGLPGRDGLRAVLLDGAVVGGFNVVDLDAVGRSTGLPVVAVTRRPPDFAAIRTALRRWFPRTAARRLAVLRRHRLVRVPTTGLPLWAAAAGCPTRDAVWLVRRTAVRGYWPEPLRLAHLVASARVPERTLKRRGRRGATGPVA